MLGASPEDIGLVAWRVAADTVLTTLIHRTSEECDPLAPEDAPCVRLMEAYPRGELTGRTAIGLDQVWPIGFELRDE